MPATATHHTLSNTDTQALTGPTATVGEWTFTARSGEDLRVVAVSDPTAPVQGVVADVFEFPRKQLQDVDPSH